MRDQYKVLAEKYIQVFDEGTDGTDEEWRYYHDIDNTIKTFTPNKEVMNIFKEWLKTKTEFGEHVNEWWETELSERIPGRLIPRGQKHVKDWAAEGRRLLIKHYYEPFLKSKEYKTYLKAKEELYRDNPGVNIDI